MILMPTVSSILGHLAIQLKDVTFSRAQFRNSLIPKQSHSLQRAYALIELSFDSENATITKCIFRSKKSIRRPISSTWRFLVLSCMLICNLSCFVQYFLVCKTCSFLNTNHNALNMFVLK